ncbi:MAG: hypothetical protein H6Q14_2483 [Bacteroidetes bacterium]|nr:hypothetical protein [Bacteroidota bacterium]
MLMAALFRQSAIKLHPFPINLHLKALANLLTKLTVLLIINFLKL